MNCIFNKNDVVIVNGKEYAVKTLLGKGKGGYSYLVEKDRNFFVLKQIHHEPCSYYNFGNKIQAEYCDYQKLIDACIRIPKMLEIDFSSERIVKEYIDGQTIFELVKKDLSVDDYLIAVRDMADKAKNKGINIDYFPTNFVVNGDLIYYVDYECNAYSDEWNFENWGVKYWSKTPEFIEYLRNCK